jgi:hypothetical protein
MILSLSTNCYSEWDIFLNFRLVISDLQKRLEIFFLVAGNVFKYTVAYRVILGTIEEMNMRTCYNQVT